MGADTKIEWADHTWSPWVGCTKVSPACDNCYAESWAKRAGSPELWQGQRRRTSADYWQRPRKWNRQAEKEGTRFRVFPSLCDPFDNQAANRTRDDMWHLIEQTPQLIWLLLTKRPQNIARMLPGSNTGTKPWGAGWPNVWFGTTVENQTEMLRRGSALRAVPAVRHFWSAEPLLGDLGTISPEIMPNWIIAGGESGPKARPSHPDWFRRLRDQCQAADVPFFFKQHGTWIEADQYDAAGMLVRDTWTGTGADGQGGLHWWKDDRADWSVRLSKKETGATLDGREWREVPA